MALSRIRLDRFISKEMSISRRDVRLMLAQKRIKVGGKIALKIDEIVDTFSVIEVDNKIIQMNEPCYIMLYKPIGVVSATKDKQHKTVIDLLKGSGVVSTDICDSLHIVGRLDLNTSGLMLLTNDSRWSSYLTSPENKVVKKYRVTLANQLSPDYLKPFEQGMYFPYEKITTKPARLEIISDYVAEVFLTEGRYHQIKRMFGRFRNPVIKLHRIAIGNLSLSADLLAGESRQLTDEEVETIKG
ncbi:MAG: 16S rRNA pseudouridine(516) synthase [Colwellia sp.]|nr:16S rRNA pseudouridine(516) synthase [Colwellia sp.]